jgi:hypothetical protein
MLIKVGSGYLDFNDSVEIERQAKLFEDIATTDGDFSYQFTAPMTSNNIYLLQNPFPDLRSKVVYNKIDCQLLDDEGNQLYTGSLRIERLSSVFELSFFGGNNNWFSLLAGSLRSLDWSEYDLDLTNANIQTAIFNTEGLVFPTVDNGLLHLRGFSLLKVEDFIAGIYVKSVFKKIFDNQTIKLEGDFFEDPNYLAAVTLSNPKNEEFIASKSAFIGKTTTQSFVAAAGVAVQITWDDDSNTPYFNNGNFSLTTESYTADVRMLVKIDLFLSCQQVVSDPIRFNTEFRVNGTMSEQFATVNPVTELFTVSHSVTLNLVANDVVDFAITKRPLEADNFDILNATVKFTPLFVYKVVGNSIVPDWTQQQYVSNFLRMFNGLPSYNPFTKTLTVNKFEDIKSKERLDLSPYVSEVSVDYGEFISNYAKNNYFSYNELSSDEIKTNFIAYSKGVLEVDNDFLDATQDVLESDFTQPIGYINPIFDAHFEKTNLIEFESDIEVDITAVSDSGTGEARFAVAEDEFALSDMVRISDSTNPAYNGDYMVSSLGAGYIELSGVSFDVDARAKATKMNFVYSDSQDVYVLHHVPLYQVANFSGLTSFRLENTDLETLAYSFFNLINTGRQVNEDFRLSFSFAQGANPLTYQETMLDQYFRQFWKVLNDPVKLVVVMYLPHLIYRRIDFLRPIQLNTAETFNLYYVNKISGYEGSDCVMELIKLP